MLNSVLYIKNMSTEFTQLNNSIITPIMKSKGFRKVGRYDYGSTFDKAIYQRDDLEVNIIFSIHPYDYPFHGIEIKVISNGNLIDQKHYSFDNGNMKSLIDELSKDLKEETIKNV